MRGLPRELASHSVEVRSPRGGWIARRECAESIERGEADALLVEPARPPARAGSGRSAGVRLRLGSESAIAKRAVHGGLLGPLLGGLYLGTGRAVDQALAAERLSAADVATPEILAIGARRVLGPMHALAIVSREIPEARNLLEFSEGAPPRGRRRLVLLACADLVRRMHAAGFLHADLNVGNLVLGRRGGEEILHVVDLDRGSFRTSLSLHARHRNLARLLRSYEKWIARHLRLTAREEILFLLRYAGRDRVLARRLAARLSRSRSRLRFRRLGWRLAAAGSKDLPARPLQ